MEVSRNYEIKRKIAQMYEVDGKTAMRMSDYMGQREFILTNPDLYVDSGRMTEEQIEALRLEFSQIMEKIISMEAFELVQKLQRNQPLWVTKDANLDAIKKTFIH